MILIIKNRLENDFDFHRLNNYSQIIFIDDGVYNVLSLNFKIINTQVNILANDYHARGEMLSSIDNQNIKLISYSEFVTITSKNKIIFIN